MVVESHSNLAVLRGGAADHRRADRSNRCKIIHLAGAADAEESLIRTRAGRNAGLDIVSIESSCGSVITVDTLQGECPFVISATHIEQ